MTYSIAQRQAGAENLALYRKPPQTNVSKIFGWFGLFAFIAVFATSKLLAASADDYFKEGINFMQKNDWNSASRSFSNALAIAPNHNGARAAARAAAMIMQTGTPFIQNTNAIPAHLPTTGFSQNGTGSRPEPTSKVVQLPRIPVARVPWDKDADAGLTWIDEPAKALKLAKELQKHVMFLLNSPKDDWRLKYTVFSSPEFADLATNSLVLCNVDMSLSSELLFLNATGGDPAEAKAKYNAYFGPLTERFVRWGAGLRILMANSDGVEIRIGDTTTTINQAWSDDFEHRDDFLKKLRDYINWTTPNWVSDLDEARRLAKAEEKKILVYFPGTATNDERIAFERSWNLMSIAAREDREDFIFVLVPGAKGQNEKATLSRKLVQELQAPAFPSVVILDEDGRRMGAYARESAFISKHSLGNSSSELRFPRKVNTTLFVPSRVTVFPPAVPSRPVNAQPPRSDWIAEMNDELQKAELEMDSKARAAFSEADRLIILQNKATVLDEIRRKWDRKIKRGY